MTIQEAKTVRLGMFTMTERLIAEYEGEPAGRVMAVVARSRRQLVVAGVRGVGLLDATESIARTKLSNAA